MSVEGCRASLLEPQARAAPIGIAGIETREGQREHDRIHDDAGNRGHPPVNSSRPSDASVATVTRARQEPCSARALHRPSAAPM